MKLRNSAIYLLLITLLLALAACGVSPAEPASPEVTSSPEASPTEPAATDEEASTADLRQVTLAMGYIPNVQFAPFYVAAERGYFAEEGIDLVFDYGMENDLIQLVGSNALQFAIGSGDQVLLGRSSGIPIRYVMNWYRRFPVAVTSLEYDISDPKTLEGKTVGLPGLFGANYIGWLALAQAAGIEADTVTLEAIGFNQVPVLAEGRVDAAVVYATNEPIQLQAEGLEPNTIYVADYVDLVSNGLITNEVTIQNDPELVQKMVRAILRGLQDTLDDPDAAFKIVTTNWVPEAGGENAEIQRAILETTLDFWRSETPGLLPRSAWEASQQMMLDAKLLDQPTNLDEVYTDTFAEQAQAQSQ